MAGHRREDRPGFSARPSQVVALAAKDPTITTAHISSPERVTRTRRFLHFAQRMDFSQYLPNARRARRAEIGRKKVQYRAFAVRRRNGCCIPGVAAAEPLALMGGLIARVLAPTAIVSIEDQTGGMNGSQGPYSHARIRYRL
jgi:hypothetical protein